MKLYCFSSIEMSKQKQNWSEAETSNNAGTKQENFFPLEHCAECREPYNISYLLHKYRIFRGQWCLFKIFGPSHMAKSTPTFDKHKSPFQFKNPPPLIL